MQMPAERGECHSDIQLLIIGRSFTFEARGASSFWDMTRINEL
jgi:hypothetical protein